ncbi:NDR1/HIN1-like protein 10 [Carica papaya]|uniref:NDR1/HIN1-like protein 10 n=1 Tax=Carica papaya TaxID=3649 RepID=UPI000B8CC1BF|nr:NDR1/HIN1-like protein 10 [Carica papaya]
MYERNRLPVRSDQQARPVQRHHSASYYAHRVRESLTNRVLKTICAIFLSLLFLLGIIAFILWLSLRPHRPRFHIREFSVPGLGQPQGFENAQIMFNVTARNSNQHIGIYYDSMEGSVFYKDQLVGSTPLLYPFYQEPKNTTIVYGVLSGASLKVNDNRWMEFTSDRGRGTVMFRLEITAVIGFKVFTWDSKHHRMHANCYVAVGPDGNLLPSAKDKRCPVYFT